MQLVSSVGLGEGFVDVYGEEKEPCAWEVFSAFPFCRRAEAERRSFVLRDSGALPGVHESSC